MKTSDFKNLNVWKRSMDLVCETYQLLRFLPPEERFGLSDQMRRAAISIPSNIAEGQGRSSEKEFIHFLSISRGSVAELHTQIIICNRLLYIDAELMNGIISKLESIDRMLKALMNSLYDRIKKNQSIKQ